MIDRILEVNRIALFGTSADPPTIAHQQILEQLSLSYDLVAVWASDNPLKQHQTPLKYRTQMLALTIEAITKNPNYLGNNIVLKPKISNRYTLITVEKARSIWGGESEYTLVIGSDLIKQIGNWYQSKKLLEQVSILVVPRSGYSITEKEIEILSNISPNFAIAKWNIPQVSSTKYRHRKDLNIVIPEVERYIKENNLYISQDNSELVKKKELFKVRVDNVIFAVDYRRERLFVLITEKLNDNLTKYWQLPGTLVRQGEQLQEAAYRTLAEKIKVKNLYLEQLYTFSNPIETTLEENRYLSVSYFAFIRFEEDQLIKDRESNLAWYEIKKVPQLAFDRDRILEYGYIRLKSKLEYSPIAFEVLPLEFTLKELYQIYSTVLGENFADYSNFRNRLLKLGFLIDTQQKVTHGAGRPATLYRFDKKAFAPLKDKPFIFR